METKSIMQHLIGKTYAEVIKNISIFDDQGDCCGYAECEVKDFVSALEGHVYATLKDVVMISYASDDYDRVVVNFIFDIGENKGVILGYELSAGSGSGWGYGAYCTLKYGDEEIASAQW